MNTSTTIAQRINLLPGELFIARNGETIWTVLGSCISVIFYNKRTKTTAMCHAQLPTNNTNIHCSSACASPCGQEENDEYKYVNCSINHMIKSFQKLGIDNKEIEVHLYGGANILGLSNDKPRIGEQNIVMARDILLRNRMPISYEDVGGFSSRAITHYSDEGFTKVKTN